MRQETLERCTALLNSTVTIDEEITLYLALFKLDSTLFSPYENRCIELITNLKTSKTSGLILCLDQDHKNKQLLCSRAITIAFAIELMSLILMNQGKNHHNRMSTSLHEQCSALLYQKLENTPEPIKSLIHSVTSSTFLDTENTLWNLAECCDLDQPSHIETAMVVHLDGWILGTLLNTVIDDQNIEKKQSRSKDVLLTALYLWHSSLIHLQTLEHELPLLKQFSRGLPEKTLLAWIREKQQIKQFREDRAIGHLLLYLSTCDQKKFSLFKRATLIALEAFQMSDDLKDLTLDFPDTPPLELEKQRAVIVQRLDQLSSAFADLVQYELPYLRSSLHLLHQRAKLDILLADVIRKFNLQKSDHNRNS